MPGPHPAVAATRCAARDALAGVPRGSLVLVACSGGPDSLALAAAAAFEAPRAGLRAAAVVVDHGLQPDSAPAAERAADACRQLGLSPVEVLVADCDRPAEASDIDHTIPYPAGPTHPSNLKALCRFHHLLKTFHGWTDHQYPDTRISVKSDIF